MTRMTGWDKFVLALLIIGALNWGLIGFFRYDLIAAICGGQLAVLSRVIYAAIGLCGVWALTLLFRREYGEIEQDGHQHGEYYHAGQH